MHDPVTLETGRPPVRTLLAPRYWGAHLLMVLAVLVATGLGVWQLDAWQARRAEAQRDLTSAGPVALSAVIGPDSPFPGRSVGQPVEMTGEWLPQSTMYVSDRRRAGRTGFWVVTPVRVDGSGSAMPVVRGWSRTPRSAAVDGSVRLTGWLQPGEGSGLVDRDPGDDVIPEMRIASLVQHVPIDLYGGFVIDRTSGPGLAQVLPTDAPTVGSTTALRNLLYAIEWWIFALFAVVIWLRWCRDTLHPERLDDPPEDSTDDPEGGRDGADGAGSVRAPGAGDRVDGPLPAQR